MEQYVGEGTSIKNAQRNAAIVALENTQLKFPNVKPNVNLRINHKQTCVDELNTFLMKQGIQAKYEIVQQPETNLELNLGTNEAWHTNIQPSCNLLSNQPKFEYNQQPSYQYRKLYQNGHPRMNINDVSFGNRPIFPNPILYCQQQYMPMNFGYNQSPYYYPFYPGYTIHNHPMVSNHVANMFNSNPNYDYYHSPNFSTNNFQQLPRSKQILNRKIFQDNMSFPNKNGSALLPNPVIVQPKTSKLTQKIGSKFEAKVEFNGYKFEGLGGTEMEARHSAAQKALIFVKENSLQLTQLNYSNHKLNNNQANSPEPEHDQSPVSLLYEFASRNRYKVTFEIVCETGQSHISVFIMKCSLHQNEDIDKEPLLVAIGEDRSKKGAKKIAAERMLFQLKENMLNKSIPEESLVYNILTRNKSLVELSEENDKLNLGSQLDASISCKFGTLLYQITRNFVIPNPSYHFLTIDMNSKLFDDYKSFVIDDNQTECLQLNLHQAKCTLTFDQKLPQQLTCLVTAIGFGTNQKMAKSISNYICLAKIGIPLPSIDVEPSNLNTKSLKFSLEHNDLTKNQTDIIEKSKEVTDSLLPLSNTELPTNVQSKILNNIQFMIFILGKLYLFSLKDNNKPIDCMVAKIENAVKTFHLKSDSTISNEVTDSMIIQIRSIFSSLQPNKYWSHLLFLSNLISVGVENEKYSKLLHFKSHFAMSKIEDNQSKDVTISIISAHCCSQLSNVFEFNLIKKNFVNFGLGFTEDDAREVAAFWTLKNLSYQARKQMINNEFEEKPKDSICENDLNLPLSAESKSISDQKKTNVSRQSHGQMVTKIPIGRLFQICIELNIRKPQFEYQQWNSSKELSSHHQELPHSLDQLVCAQCVLVFNQEVPEQLSAKVILRGIAPNQRLARAICAYIGVCYLGHPISLENFSPLFKLNNFSGYVQYSIRNNFICLSKLKWRLPIDQPLSQISSYSDDITKEINCNIELLIRLLKEIYRPFLKNHKMVCPNQLVARIDNELFEYHNQRQQIMDESSTFDQCSENIRNCLDRFWEKYDPTLYWHHLLMLTSIVSMLTTNLSKSLTPPIFEVKCQLIKMTDSGFDEQENAAQSISNAIITFNTSASNSFETYGITKKLFLAFALSHDEEIAKEVASYKALRYLAINLWK